MLTTLSMLYMLEAYLWLLISNAVVAVALPPGEAEAYHYFGKSTEHGTPQPVQRFSKLSKDDFDRLAHSGRPFVVEDGGAGQPMVGWSCDRFRKEFPDSIVKAEYVKTENPFFPITSEWDKASHPIPKADPHGPQYAPWYWGIKGADNPEEAGTLFKGSTNLLPRVQKKIKLPSFFRKSRDNKAEVFGSPEFWFSVPKAGATMHMDGHCESTYAIQLFGTRKWRLGWAPEVPNGTLYKSGTYDDSSVKGKSYVPPLEATVSQGEALVMPSGFLHETQNIGDECAVSLTFQFKDPVPSGYFRSSLRHLRRSEDFGECWEFMALLASVGVESEAPQNVKRLMTKVDTDGDGSFSLAEAKGMIARAAHAFHDVNQDGTVTIEELQSGWRAWHEADKEAKGAKRVKPKSFTYLSKERSEL